MHPNTKSVVLAQETSTEEEYKNMGAASTEKTFPAVISTLLFVAFLLLSSFSPVVVSEASTVVVGSGRDDHRHLLANQTFRPRQETMKLRRIRAYLKKINKPASPDGDLIDCVQSHLQPAFDHPELRGKKPLEPPERPKGAVPIRRTREKDVVRASSVRRFGRKTIRRVRRDTMSSDHETDAYQTTGCYNLLCSGFVQTNNRIAIGAAISPRSSYNARQFDIGITIWKDPKHGHWWLEFGSGLLIGYWPSFLFSHLRGHASMIQFGGEIVNSRSTGSHTATQMGSGHFADEGFGKASYFRNLQTVDWDNSLVPLSNLHLLADHPNCYDIRAGRNNVWGNYFYYGGPGRNSNCP
nr:uncharacterized protein LOC109149638 [Ipomoea batatas]GMC54424.1 uncharacterized protein LOC109149638 [Ipomoea batatas]